MTPAATDDSGAEEAVKRFIKECELLAHDAIRNLDRRIRRDMSLNFYKTAYSSAAAWPFVKTYVGGTNKCSFSILMFLANGFIPDEKIMGREDGENVVLLMCRYFDHQNMMSFFATTANVTISRQCVRQVSQLLHDGGAPEKAVCPRRVSEQFEGAFIYADMWTVLLTGPLDRHKKNLGRLSFPVPAKDGLLLCNLKNGEQLMVYAFVPDGNLSSTQKEAKGKLEMLMSPFLNSMVQFKHIPGEPHVRTLNKSIHFRPVRFLAVMLGRYVHQRFRPEDYLELYGCGDGGDGNLTAQVIADAMKGDRVFTSIPKDAPEMKELEELTAAYVAMGEEEFLKKKGPSLPFA